MVVKVGLVVSSYFFNNINLLSFNFSFSNAISTHTGQQTLGNLCLTPHTEARRVARAVLPVGISGEMSVNDRNVVK